MSEMGDIMSVEPFEAEVLACQWHSREVKVSFFSRFAHLFL
jgi:hypothetical protein